MTTKFGFQITVDTRTIWIFPEDVEAALATAKVQAEAALSDATELVKARAKTGIVYGWSRAVGEDPINLGVFRDLTRFIDTSIIAPLPAAVKPSFSVDQEFEKLVQGLPDPVNKAVDDLTSKAIFELDGLRLKIPGTDSTEKIQFEIAMLINLIPLDLVLGPFKLNRLYARLGNFSTVVENTSL